MRSKNGSILELFGSGGGAATAKRRSVPRSQVEESPTATNNVALPT